MRQCLYRVPVDARHVLARYQRVARNRDCDVVIAYATSAVRESINGGDFVLAATGWSHNFDVMRAEIAKEPRAVLAFSDECRFWVAHSSS